MTVQTNCSSTLATQYRAPRVLPDLAGWITRRIELARDRAEVRRMLDLDVALLFDIGLVHEDIYWALNSSSDTLPSHRLQALREERSRERLISLGIRRRQDAVRA